MTATLISMLERRRALAAQPIAELKVDPFSRLAWIADRDARFTPIAHQLISLGPAELTAKAEAELWEQEVEPAQACADPIPPACLAAMDKAKLISRLAELIDGNPFTKYCSGAEDIRAAVILTRQNIEVAPQLLCTFSLSTVLRHVWFRRLHAVHLAAAEAGREELASLRAGVNAAGQAALAAVEARFGPTLVGKVLPRPRSFDSYAAVHEWKALAPRNIKVRLVADHQQRVQNRAAEILTRAQSWIDRASRSSYQLGDEVLVDGAPAVVIEERRTWWGGLRYVVQTADGRRLRVAANRLELELPAELSVVVKALRILALELLSDRRDAAIRAGRTVIMLKSATESTYSSGRVAREDRSTVVVRLGCACEHAIRRRRLIPLGRFLSLAENAQRRLCSTIAELLEERLFQSFLRDWGTTAEGFRSIIFEDASPRAESITGTERAADERLRALERELAGLDRRAAYMARYLAAADVRSTISVNETGNDPTSR